jgi:hypothetical protein
MVSLASGPVIELQDGAVTRQYRAREVFGGSRRKSPDSKPEDP